MIEASIIFSVKVKKHPVKDREYNYCVPKYRVYVNDSLVTEREWTYSSKEYIQERVWLNLEDNTNKLRLEPVLKYKDEFELSNFQILKHLKDNEWDIDKDSHTQKDLEITFKV